MSLDVHVMPAVISTFQGLVDSNNQPLFKAVDEGSSLSIAESPTVWMQNDGSVSPEFAGDTLETTNWNITARVLYQWAPDQWNAERSLEQIIEPVRVAFRSHIMLGQAQNPPVGGVTIARAKIAGTDWGYAFINAIWYRYVDIKVEVREKIVVTYGP